jgi:Ca2+/Na+ antiporter
MAAGSSAPELAASLIGLFVAKDDIGIGAVVGSAVFNIAFVISICALFAGSIVRIHWWPIVRDSFFYLISVRIMSDKSFYIPIRGHRLIT